MITSVTGSEMYLKFSPGNTNFSNYKSICTNHNHMLPVNIIVNSYEN